MICRVFQSMTRIRTTSLATVLLMMILALTATSAAEPRATAPEWPVTIAPLNRAVQSLELPEGDVVERYDRGGVVIRPAEGRGDVDYSVRSWAGHLEAIPDDAPAAVRTKDAQRAHYATAGLPRNTAMPSGAEDTHTLTIRHLDREGALVTPVETMVATPKADIVETVYDDVSVLTLPTGTYDIQSYIRLPNPQIEEDRVFLSYPAVELDRDIEIVLDSARARPVKVAAPAPGLEPADIIFAFGRPEGMQFAYFTGTDFEGLATANLGPRHTEGFQSTMNVTFCNVIPDQWCSPTSPTHYRLLWFMDGGLFTGFDKSVDRGDLASVRVNAGTVTADGLSSTGEWLGIASGRPADARPFLDIGITTASQRTLPARTVEYYTAGTVEWLRAYEEWMIGPGGEMPDFPTVRLGTAPVTYRPGSSRDETWNGLTLGPGMPSYSSRPLDPRARPFLTRIGDQIRYDMPLFTDSGGHAGFAPGPGTTSLRWADA